ncbi:predicted protein [Histoplasma capsulatum var. duboisii H88]|uniref:Predicted protein n=1 Tax=Ajellomyces capsulatus (strain H88) TaxID=544711 RepID=F0U5M7_AJEC8|nr:predicted protein [Histoplasma capsulatum var. duboisii H88]
MGSHMKDKAEKKQLCGMLVSWKASKGVLTAISACRLELFLLRIHVALGVIGVVLIELGLKALTLSPFPFTELPTPCEDGRRSRNINFSAALTASDYGITRVSEGG